MLLQKDVDDDFVDDEYAPEEVTDENSKDFEDDYQLPEILEEARTLTRQYIDMFFQDKQMHYGGKIPKYLLHSKERISLVMNTTIYDAVGVAYNALERELPPQQLAKSKKSGALTEDIYLVRDTLNKLAKNCIPKRFAGGMLLMYLELCEGTEFE